ncbi:MAG: hypothetical protein HAW62_02170 [Endozoicomonadaceae bacterium]|nr:hypothetical protein [Endozoicomonadaceae bacterium]
MDFMQFTQLKLIQTLIIHDKKILLLVIGTLVFILSLLKSVDLVQTSLLLTEPEPYEETIKSENFFTIADFYSIFGTPPTNYNQIIPKTSLKLTLKGILTDNNNKRASAIIQNANEPDKLYQIGEKLPGGARLKSVYSKYAVILYQGKEQKIAFPEAKTTLTLIHNHEKERNNTLLKKKNTANNVDKFSNLKKLEQPSKTNAEKKH